MYQENPLERIESAIKCVPLHQLVISLDLKDMQGGLFAGLTEIAMTTLQELLIEEIHDLLNAERHISVFLNRLTEKVQSEKLRTAIAECGQATQRHISDLENLLYHLRQPSQALQVPPLECLIRMCNLKISQMETPQLRDTFLAASLQKVKHYEISCYSIAYSHAMQTGMTGTADLLLEILEDERQLGEQLVCLSRDVDGAWFDIEKANS